ncbi:sperm axonemal maintenance protein CFAP97D1-like [Emys orbicularis]|uniref:sperm axonemal maintenance protein CFAP97D1-like n=1 Tax=Emys orbicularis TaxID=82168 RepID=UPI0031FC6199
MSRGYQPILPAASRYLQEKWDKAAYRQHRSKVDSASPAVDTQGPQPPSHLQLNLKRMQLDREHQAVRERDDCIRSARLVAIVQSTGRVDNWNSYSVCSLSSERRRRELAQIGVENQRLVGRLRQQQSEYAREPWERHWERVELIRNSIARHPRSMRALQAGQRASPRSPEEILWKDTQS